MCLFVYSLFNFSLSLSLSSALYSKFQTVSSGLEDPSSSSLLLNKEYSVYTWEGYHQYQVLKEERNEGVNVNIKNDIILEVL